VQEVVAKALAEGVIVEAEVVANEGLVGHAA